MKSPFFSRFQLEEFGGVHGSGEHVYDFLMS
jgi:hypothetical protein